MVVTNLTCLVVRETGLFPGGSFGGDPCKAIFGAFQSMSYYYARINHQHLISCHSDLPRWH